jgi:hypothetical protein
VETQVDPAVLDAAAGRCADLARRFTTAVTRVEPDTAAALGGLGEGFALRTALDRVWASRRDEFGRFERYLVKVGDALTTTAADYRRSDAVSWYRFAYLREE